MALPFLSRIVLMGGFVLGIAIPLAACGDDNASNATPSASPGVANETPTSTQEVGTPTPIPTPRVLPPSDESSPWSLAKWLDESLRAGDVTPFVLRARAEALECDEHNTPPSYTFGPCTTIGEVLEVMPVSLVSAEDGTAPIQYLQPPELRDHFQELVDDELPPATDEYGTGELHVFAYYVYGERVLIVATAITSAGRTSQLTYWEWDEADHSWMLTEAVQTSGPRAALDLDPRLGVATGTWTRFDPAGPPAPPEPVVAQPPFSDFMAEARAAVDLLNAQFFVSRFEARHISCTEANTPQQGIGAPPCEFVGQELDVISWNHGVEGGDVPVADAATIFGSWFEDSLPDERDEYGSGELRVIGFQDAGGTGTMALSALVCPESTGYDVPWRFIITVGFVFRDGEWRIAAAGTPAYPEVAAWMALKGEEFSGWQRWE